VAMKAVLEGEEAEIVTVSSGNEALSAMLDGDFAVVLLDVQMPGMDGFETAELMRANSRTRDIPIVFVTAVNTEPRFVSRGYESGAIDYLFKPVDPLVLRSKVSIFLELHRRRAALEEALEENVTLLREIHHRVKNNLAIVSSIIGLQENYLKDPADAPILRDLRSRIDAIGLVYDLVHKTGEVSDLNMRAYLTELAEGIAESAEGPTGGLDLRLDLDEASLDVKRGISVGLIVNELMTNSMKYAFGPRDASSHGAISVSFKRREGVFVAAVEDDGIGFDSPPDFSKAATFGLGLVHSLARQLGGSARKRPTGAGTRVEVAFPVAEDA
jgi:two-component sensor histidine kinase